MRKGNRSCKDFEICEIVDKGSENEDDGPERKRKENGFRAEGEMEISVWEVNLEGHLIRDIKDPAGYMNVEFRSWISGSSTKM